MKPRYVASAETPDSGHNGRMETENAETGLVTSAGWISESNCSLDEFHRIVSVSTDAAVIPNAKEVVQGVPVYDASILSTAAQDRERSRALASELAGILSTGPGIVVFRQAVPLPVLDRATSAFFELIESERLEGVAAGDHFAKPGANDRVWNALEKLALREPSVFAEYYQCEALAVTSLAWLGPHYQMTSQINVVNPGGEAQRPHRDYHIGFMSNHEAEQFPLHAHRLSPALTLQGAIAHCDMPIETGPTLYLPHSQKYDLGYLAWRRPDFVDYFERNHVQLSLSAGDAVFFNPAVFHAAGTNRTGAVRRIANLVQVSSAMGRSMEYVNRAAMTVAVYPHLVSISDEVARERVIASTAEGYAFPGDLDRDQPVGGLAPPSQADIVRKALTEGWSLDELKTDLQKEGSSQ